MKNSPCWLMITLATNAKMAENQQLTTCGFAITALCVERAGQRFQGSLFIKLQSLNQNLQGRCVQWTTRTMAPIKGAPIQHSSIVCQMLERRGRGLKSCSAKSLVRDGKSSRKWLEKKKQKKMGRFSGRSVSSSLASVQEVLKKKQPKKNPLQHPVRSRQSTCTSGGLS